MGSTAEYLVQLLPELIVTIGACAVLFAGLVRGTSGRTVSAGLSVGCTAYHVTH